MSLRSLRGVPPSDRAVAKALLLRHPRRNMYLLSKLESGDGTNETAAEGALTGRMQNGRLEGVAYLRRGGLLVLAEADETFQQEAAELFSAVEGGWRVLVAPESDAATFVEASRRLGVGFELDRRQAFLVLTGVRTDGPSLAVRAAREEDLDRLVSMSVGLAEEDLGLSAQEADLARAREVLASELPRGRMFVAEFEGRVSFKANVSARSERFGAQIEGIYTAPELRNRGIATAAIRSLCAALLREAPFVCLHVGEANRPARRCYEKVGFAAEETFRLARRTR